MGYFLEEIKNSIDFFLRRKIRFSRHNYYVGNEPKDDLFEDDASLKEQEERLYDKYNLFSVKNNTTQNNYLENLYTIDVLDKFLKVNPKDELKVLDIGSKNWFYAKGEYYFFQKYCNNLSLDGIELDAYRLYMSFYSRYEVAKFYSSDLPGAKYIVGDFLEHKQKYDYIVWFLPFILKYPLVKWGLPMRYFRPKEMLEHAIDSLNDGGKILIINQEMEEYIMQEQLYKEIGACYELLGEVNSDFWLYKYKRYVSVVSKN